MVDLCLDDPWTGAKADRSERSSRYQCLVLWLAVNFAGVWLDVGPLIITGCAAESQSPSAPGAGFSGTELPADGLTIRSADPATDLSVTITPRLAGAIHSVRWRGRELIDSFDHGRQLQSASNFDAGSPITAETFNPTEAGSQRDGAGDHSSSQLLHVVAGQDWLQTTTRMAFWLAPNERSGNEPAKNRTIVSDHLLIKRVQVGIAEWPAALQYHVTFVVPPGEGHRDGVFESLTGYMPQEFSRFETWNPLTGELGAIDDGPGEQVLPLVFSTADGTVAMGVFGKLAESATAGITGPTYGRFRFPAEHVTKWNCVFRVHAPPRGLAAGNYSFRQIVVLGGRQELARTLQQIKIP